MNKAAVVEALIAGLEAELAAARGASREAASYATDEEARADSKWDTQGLEASYLAAGQAQHARAISETLLRIRSRREELAGPSRRAEAGALVECDWGNEKEWFFLAPAGGGEDLLVEGVRVTVVSPQSPLYTRLHGKVTGDTWTAPDGSRARLSRVR